MILVRTLLKGKIWRGGRLSRGFIMGIKGRLVLEGFVFWLRSLGEREGWNLIRFFIFVLRLRYSNSSLRSSLGSKVSYLSGWEG